MDAVLPAESLSIQMVWKWLVERVQGVLSSPGTPRAVDPRLYAATERFGGRVLEAEDLEDLHGRLRSVVKNRRRLRQLLHFGGQAFQEIAASPLPSGEEIGEVFLHLLGDSPVVRRCVRLQSVRYNIAISSLSSTEDSAEEDLDHFDFINFLELLESFKMPPILRSLFYEVLVGEVALLALFAPFVDPVRWRCEPWVRLALLEQICDSARANLRLLSLLPGLDIPEDVLPAEERLDIEALMEEFMLRESYIIEPDTDVAPEYAGAVLEDLLGTAPVRPEVAALFAD